MTILHLPYSGWARAVPSRLRRFYWSVAHNPARINGRKKKGIKALTTLTEFARSAWFDEGTHRLTSPLTNIAVGWFGRTKSEEYCVLSKNFPGLSPNPGLPAPEGTTLVRTKMNPSVYLGVETFLRQIIGVEVGIDDVAYVAIGTPSEHTPFIGWSDAGYSDGGTRSVDGMTNQQHATSKELVWVYATSARSIQGDPTFDAEKLVFQVSFVEGALASTTRYRKSQDSRVKSATNLSEFRAAILDRHSLATPVQEIVSGTVRYVKRDVWLGWLSP